MSSTIDKDEQETVKATITWPIIKGGKNLSGIKDIYINIKNFPKIWKIYLSIINNPAVDNQDRILLDTTSTIDQDIYQTYWNTKLYPNGEYELYAELFDSSNNRIFTTEFFNIINYLSLIHI